MAHCNAQQNIFLITLTLMHTRTHTHTTHPHSHSHTHLLSLLQNSWLDIRPYMDSAPYSVNESSSVKRCYRFFRTMGLRHLVVVNAFHKVTGIITRNDVTHHRMQSHWVKEVRMMGCCVCGMRQCLTRPPILSHLALFFPISYSCS
jgi:CBS domain